MSPDGFFDGFDDDVVKKMNEFNTHSLRGRASIFDFDPLLIQRFKALAPASAILILENMMANQGFDAFLEFVLDAAIVKFERNVVGLDLAKQNLEALQQVERLRKCLNNVETERDGLQHQYDELVSQREALKRKREDDSALADELHDLKHRCIIEKKLLQAQNDRERHDMQEDIARLRGERDRLRDDQDRVNKLILIIGRSALINGGRSDGIEHTRGDEFVQCCRDHQPKHHPPFDCVVASRLKDLPKSKRAYVITLLDEDKKLSLPLYHADAVRNINPYLMSKIIQIRDMVG